MVTQAIRRGPRRQKVNRETDGEANHETDRQVNRGWSCTNKEAKKMQKKLNQAESAYTKYERLMGVVGAWLAQCGESSPLALRRRVVRRLQAHAAKANELAATLSATLPSDTATTTT